MYKLLREQQDEEMKKKQAHQHQIWQHVQDRLAEHNQILEREKAEESKKARRQQQKEAVEAAATMDEEDNEDTASPIVSAGAGADEDSSTVTSSAGSSPDTTPAKKRSIRWGLQNNQTKSMCCSSRINVTWQLVFVFAC
jgi:membrane protein involved in colicin uptake